MSNQISLTIPNDDPIALRAFGNALEEMAVAHGATVQQRVVSATLTDDQLDELKIGLKVPTHKIEAPEFDASDCVVTVNGERIEGFADETGTQLATSDTIDADGLPWDARIHSGNQERNADNTWRVRRRPKDLTPEQWAEQVAQVRDELFALMAIPVATSDYSADAPAAHEVMTTELGYDPAVAGGDYSVKVPVTDTESPSAVFGAPEPMEVPPVTVEVPPAPPLADPVPPAPAPLPPVADPVPPAPAPLPTATTGVPATLAELMTWLTSKAPSDDAGRAARLEQINCIVARHGLVTLGQLQKRLDLIPQVYADLVKELGQ